MKALLYLTITQIKNKILGLKKKPLTAIGLVFLVIYFVFITVTLGGFARDIKLDNNYGLTYLLCLFGIFTILGTLFTFSFNYGLKFSQGDTQFLFTSPISSKTVLLFTLAKAELLSILIHEVLVFVGGYFVFGLTLGKALLLFAYVILVELMLDISTAIFVYGDESKRGWVRKLAKITVGIIFSWLVLVLFKNYLSYGLSPMMITSFVMDPLFKFVPILGWYAGGIQYLILGYGGYHFWNMLLLFFSLGCLLIGAYRMRIYGEFYEASSAVAKKLADYKKAKMKASADGMKVKYRLKGKARYRFEGAFALFDRQLNEYKRRRLFIFNIASLFRMAIGVGTLIIIRFLVNVSEDFFGNGTILILCILTLYVTFLLSSTNEKWMDELKSVFFYMIPDHILKKYLAIILCDMIRFFIEGFVIILPLVITQNMSGFFALAYIMVYVFVQIFALNVKVINHNLLMPLLGVVGSMFGRYFMITLFIGVLLASFGLGYMVMRSITSAMFLSLIPTIILAVLSLWVVSLTIRKLEAVEGI